MLLYLLPIYAGCKLFSGVNGTLPCQPFKLYVPRCRVHHQMCELLISHRHRKRGGGGGGGGGQWRRLPPHCQSHPVLHVIMNKCNYKVCSAYLTACFSLHLSRCSHCLPPLGVSYSPDSAKMGVVWRQCGCGQKIRMRYTCNPIFCPHNL